MSSLITYVGMDVHKDSIALACLKGSAQQGESFQIPNEPGKIRRTIRRLQRGGELRTWYEAGPCGYALWRILEPRRVSFGVA